jgi:hypothetical protein
MNESDTREQKFIQLKISRNRGYHIVPLRSLDISDPPRENDSVQPNLSISASCLATPKSALEPKQDVKCRAVFKFLLRCFKRSSSNAIQNDPGAKYIIKEKESDRTH